MGARLAREDAEQQADDIGPPTEVPEQIASYFHWDAWMRNLRYNHSVYDAPGGVFRDL